jgi:transposase
VKTEMSLHVLAYNFRRLIAVLGIADMMKAIKAFIHLRRLKPVMQTIFLAMVKKKCEENMALLRAS